jgi:cobyric acid synthase
MPLIDNITVARALTTGDTPVRIILKIKRGNVCADAPAQKKAIKKSSRERIKTSNPAATKAGIKIGNTTL